MEARRLYLDTAARQFVSSPDSPLTGVGNSFFEEDVEQIELYFLRPTGDITRPYDYVNYSANTVKLAVGVTAPAALQTSWTAISTAITASITTITGGGSGNNEIQKLTFSGNLPSEGGIFFTMPSRAVTVSGVSSGVFAASSHGLLNGQTVALSAFTISGSTFSNSTYFVIDRTPNTFGIAAIENGAAIPAVVTSGGGTATLPSISTNVVAAADLTASNIQAAFVNAGIVLAGQAQIIVSGSYAIGFTFTFANSQGGINFDPLLVSSTLVAAQGLAANVSFNTTEVASIISVGAGNDCRMEVEVSAGAARQTYTQGATLSADIITSTSPAPLPAITPASSFNLIAPNSDVWNVTIDNDGVLTATKQ
jgi:hypothetical protein